MKNRCDQSRQLILITDISPESRGSGSLHLKDLIKCFDNYGGLKIININSKSIDYHRSSTSIEDLSDLNFHSNFVNLNINILFEDTNLNSSDQAAYLHRIRINSFRFFKELNCKLASTIENTTVLIFVQWPGMIFLWEAFAKSKWRTVPILMDRYEPLFIAFSLSEASKAVIRDSFDCALSNSSGLLVGSKKAALALTRRLQVPCREILSIFRGKNRSSLNSNLNLSKSQEKMNFPIRFALAGQLYAKDAIQLFLDGLTALNVRANKADEKYLLSYYGDHPIHAIYSHNCITSYGILEYSDLMRTLSDSCSFGVIPYSFDPLFASSAAFSFPSKLVACIQAGLIPIYIGPKESSVFDLFSEYDLSDLCITNESVDSVVNQISKILTLDQTLFHRKISMLSTNFCLDYLQNCVNDVLDHAL